MSSVKKDVILFFIAKVVVGVISLLLVSLYSAMVPPAAYGEYSLISGLSSALIAVFIGWIGSSSLRYYIDYENEKKKFYSNIIAYTFFMLLLISLILFGYSFFSTKIPISKYLPFVFIYTFSYSLVDIFEKVLRAAQKTVTYTIGVIIQSCISIGLFYILAKVFNMEADAIFLSNSVSRLIFLVIAFISLGFFNYFRVGRVDSQLLKKFLKYGIPMIGIWGVSWILSYCDRYVIALFYDTVNVGIYDMSYKLSENTINMFISAFTLAIFPSLIRTWKEKGKEEVEAKITNILQYYFLMVIPAVVGLSLVSEKIYLGIINQQYASGQSIIIIVSIGMFFNGLNSILNKIWQLNEKTKYIFYIMLLSVIINIVLNVILIPHFGIIVAATTTLISYIVSTIVTYYLSRKEFKIRVDIKGLFKTIFSTFVMAIFILLFNNIVDNTIMLMIEVVLGIVVYGVVSFLVGNISIKDLKVK